MNSVWAGIATHMHNQLVPRERKNPIVAPGAPNPKGQEWKLRREIHEKRKKEFAKLLAQTKHKPYYIEDFLDECGFENETRFRRWVTKYAHATDRVITFDAPRLDGTIFSKISYEHRSRPNIKES